MKERYIYLVIRHGLDNEVAILDAYDSEARADEVAQDYGHNEIQSHEVEKVLFKDYS